jgi:dolichol-phosphate mannosyltransferase
MAELDIVIPVYNERENILRVLAALDRDVRTPSRVMICYDRDDDDTLPAARSFRPQRLELAYVKNRGKGAFGAVVTGFADSSAPAVLVFPADDDYNTHRIDAMVEKFREGCDIVAASRFMPGGTMKGAPPLKAVLVRGSAFALHHLARLPTHDPSNGLRLFSQRVIRSIPLESTRGFTYSIELLVKCHRLGWRIGEVAAEWHERNAGTSRFQVVKWLPDYLVWFGYAFQTTYLSRGPKTVRTIT